MLNSKTSYRDRGLILIPNFVDHSGDVVNEIQLVKSLCRERTCIILGFTRESKLIQLREFIADLRREEWARNSIILPLPIFRPYTMSLLLSSILLTPIIILLDRLKPVKFIYVRSSPLAFAFMFTPSLARKTCVKIPEIIEEIFEDGEKMLGRIILFVYKLADRLVLERAGYISVLSPLLLKKITFRRGILPSGKIIWVPAGIDREKIETIRKRTSYCINKDAYTIGFTGFLAWWQGVDILVKAVARIKNSFDKPVKLLIVGDGPERRKIEKLCNELGINCYITGFLKHEEALKITKEFDVLAVPRRRISTTESVVPLKIIEAWVLGVPVVATAHEVFKYMGLRDKEDIVLCESVPDDVANKILMVLTDRELRMQLLKRGRQIAENYFYDKIAKDILKYFDSR